MKAYIIRKFEIRDTILHQTAVKREKQKKILINEVLSALGWSGLTMSIGGHVFFFIRSLQQVFVILCTVAKNVMEGHFEYGIRMPRDGGIHAGSGGGGAHRLGLVTHFAANG